MTGGRMQVAVTLQTSPVERRGVVAGQRGMEQLVERSLGPDVTRAALIGGGGVLRDEIARRRRLPSPRAADH